MESLCEKARLATLKLRKKELNNSLLKSNLLKTLLQIKKENDQQFDV